MISVLLILLAIVATCAALYFLVDAIMRRRATSLLESSVEELGLTPQRPAVRGSRLERWLSKAGFRSASAASTFLAATAGGIAFGFLSMYIMNESGIVDQMREAVSLIPGGVGEVFAMMASAGPALVLLSFAFAPALIVRAKRRQRVEAIEQDMAPSLELLATLAEAGLGFDAGISRIQESESGGRPLSEEFRIYQHDALGGIPRMQSLRRMADRVDVGSMSIFVSAMVQAEQAGASLAETLRTQADDLRDRRKMRALVLAQGLPVKLAFPLMFCFLPGIFYSTLGPVLSQLVDVVDNVIRRR